jgi:hypothetical protein
MGVAETETLRRVNEVLEGFDTAFDRGVWIRSYLADERLVPRRGERYWPGDDQIEDCRRRGQRALDLVRSRGFDLIGEADQLLVPDDLPGRRHPDSVTDGEVAQVAVETIAVMLADVRRLTRRNKRLERLAHRRGTAGRLVGRGGAARSRLRRLLGRLLGRLPGRR